MKNVRKLTEGAVLLAAFTVLLLISIYVPFIGAIVVLFLAVPFIIFAAKNDWKSIGVFLIAAILLSIIMGSLMSLPLTLIYGTTGSVIGYLIQKQSSRISILMAGSLVFLVNLIIIYAVSIVFFQIDIINQMIDAMQESLNMSADLLKNFGNEKETEKVMEQYKNGLALMKTLIPTLFVLFSFMSVFIIQLVSLPIVKRFGITVEKWKSIKDITLPKSVLWYFLFTLLASMFLNPEEGTYLYTTIINLTYILQFLMIFQGYTFLFAFFHQNGMSKSISVIIAIVTFIIPIFLYIIGILGIIDLGFDLRKKFKKE